MLRLDELTALNVRAVFATPIHGDIFVEYVRDLLRETPNQSLAAGGVSLFPARLLPPRVPPLQLPLPPMKHFRKSGRYRPSS